MTDYNTEKDIGFIVWFTKWLIIGRIIGGILVALPIIILWGVLIVGLQYKSNLIETKRQAFEQCVKEVKTYPKKGGYIIVKGGLVKESDIQSYCVYGNPSIYGTNIPVE